MKNCNTCAWFCHISSQCFVEAIRPELAVDVLPTDSCPDWTSDGLTAEERDALVTMGEDA